MGLVKEVDFPINPDGLTQARQFVSPLIESELLDSGENMLAHADAVAQLLNSVGAAHDLQIATYLGYAVPMLKRAPEILAKKFGKSLTVLAVDAAEIVKVQRQARLRILHQPTAEAEEIALQTENVRKMLLAFSRDLRVVLMRLGSRLQTLRFYASIKQIAPRDLAQESLTVFAPLANRLGLWQLKWELEDLSFRFLEPQTYQSIARSLDQKRTQREQHVAQLSEHIKSSLLQLGFKAQVSGRAKHIYSIVKKMRGKKLSFDGVYDVTALRVLVNNVNECYAVLAWIHTAFEPIASEFDDYIAKPKQNGYQSIHTVVRDNSETGGARPVEIQIRTHTMHQHAESGVAAHWAYKEAGVKGYSGVQATGAYDAKIAVIRQLIAWERDLSSQDGYDTNVMAAKVLADRIYVLTPEAKVVDLPAGSTAIDFAYALHTDLGHRCRGAKVEGTLVSLNTPLQNGQTVEVIASKEGGPSRDWLNQELGFLVSHRARSKVRAWFNAEQAEQTIAKGRDWVEKILQREGKTSIAMDTLAGKLDFANANEMFMTAGKDELSTRAIELVLRPTDPIDKSSTESELVQLKNKAAKNSNRTSPSGVIALGVGAVLTQLAKCCKPAPPDEITGFVTRGKGLSVHRAQCANFKTMAQREPDRVMQVAWTDTASLGAGNKRHAAYPVDIQIQAIDRQGLLRDISEVFAREKMNVIGVQTQSVKSTQTDHDTAWMTFTIEINEVKRLENALAVVRNVKGVQRALRK